MMRKTLFPRRRDAEHSLVHWPLTRPAEDPLTWEIRSRGPVAIVIIDGELDVGTAPGLSGQLVPLADIGRHLILDLAGVPFCDCAGLNLFLRLQRRTSAAGGSLHLAGLTAPVRRLIMLGRLNDVLTITDSVADVISALESVKITEPSLPGSHLGNSALLCAARAAP
jgi:anti-anti-sigma factor